MAGLIKIDPKLAKANSKAVIIRILPRKAPSFNGQRNHDLRNGSIPKYVDQSLIYQNSVIIETPKPAVFFKKCKEIRSQRNMERAMKSGGNVAYVGIFGFGAEDKKRFVKLSIEDQDKAYRKMAEAVAERLNVQLMGLTAHRDETAPHAHFAVPAYNNDGVPLSTSVKRGALMDLQTVVADAIKEFAPQIERGRPREVRTENGATMAETNNKTVRELHGSLESDRLAKIAEIEGLTVEVLQLSEKADKNLQLVGEAKTNLLNMEIKDEDRAAELYKRVKSYEASLCKLNSEIEDGDKKLANLQASISERQAEADKIVEDARFLASTIEREAASEGAKVGAKVAAKLVADSFTKRLQRKPDGGWAGEDLTDDEEMLWPSISPTLNKLSNWFSKFAKRLDALPLEQRPENRPLDLDDGPSL